ncbi:MAG TPA: metallophosphoesterase [Vicinamibacterales bacterium]|nr:metallophosphoesterase [Vicinamibacterales bacterium]
MGLPVLAGTARIWAAAVLAAVAAVVGTAGGPQFTPLSDGPFLVKPYLQLGDLPKLSPAEPVRVLWQALDERGIKWAVEVRQGASEPWRPAIASAGRLIPAVGATPAFRLFNVPVTRLAPGAAFEYRVSRNGEVVFEATGKTRAAAHQVHRVAVTGDTGANTEQERRIVHQMHRAEPDFVAIAGDIVYSTGRMSEYREKYFPIFNADTPSPETGAPLLRSRLSFGAYGNHDAGTGDLDRDPDGQAYFLNWAFPLNGPYPQAGLPNTQTIKGPPDRVQAHLTLLRSTFPRMANYSFDYGNAHWTFLDSNTYVDWSDAYLRNWLARDLAAARDATWKFVVFHHPPFNSSRAHFNDQQMRLISDILEHRGVDIVFSGHVHNYQRTRPLKFLATPTPERTFKVGASNVVNGDFGIDQGFDGVKDTTPEGVLYVVTGAGGAGAYDPDQTDNVPTWQPFTARLVSDVYSFTLLDIDGATLTLRQISELGDEIDRIVVTKPSRRADTTSARILQ